MNKPISRREFIKAGSAFVLTLFLARLYGCSFFDTDTPEEIIAREYLNAWAENLEMIKHGRPHYTEPIVAVGESHGYRGGDFNGLTDIVEKSGTRAVGLEFLKYGDPVVESFNKGLSTPEQMFNHYNSGTMWSRDKSLQRFFEYIQENGIRLYGIEPFSSEESDMQKQQEDRSELMIDCIEKTMNHEDKGVFLTGYLHTGPKIVRYNLPVNAVRWNFWKDSEEVLEEPLELYNYTFNKVAEGDNSFRPVNYAFFMEEPVRYTVEGRFGSDVGTVFLVEPVELKLGTGDMVNELEDAVGKGSIKQERDRIYKNIEFIKESSPLESNIDEYGISIKVSGDTVYNPERHFFIKRPSFYCYSILV